MNCCKMLNKNQCFICKTKVNKRVPFVSCIRCHIYMHYNYYDNNKTSKEYTQCNNCQKVGTIGIPAKFVKLIEETNLNY